MSLGHNGFPLESIAREALFERLALGAARAPTVLTPNRRLAQSLQADFARWQVARGQAAWETADILPFAALMERAWDDALHAPGGAALPLLATPAQEQALWEEAIATHGGAALLSPAAAAAQCRESWTLLHAWRLADRIRGHAAGDDAQAFLEWSGRYAQRLREHHLTDAAQLPDVVVPLLGQEGVRRPGALVLAGFDIVTPQAHDVLAALAAQGCPLLQAAPVARTALARRIELLDAAEELEVAAQWARTRLEQGGRRIGVVVPDLTARRAQVERAFATTLRPDHLAARDGAALPFELSLGKPLAEYPLVADALLVLALAGPEVAFEDASRVVRSPFIDGAEAELGVRARLDARLRRRAPATLAPDALLRLCKSDKAPAAPRLVATLERLAALRKGQLFAPRPASEWARAFSAALREVGFPGERGLDSAEHQALAKWHEVLADLARLERVAGTLGFGAALRRLRAMAADTIFQPEGHEAPVQVMGILESAGRDFDHLWVMGLTDAAWPLPARPAPFIPVALQRAVGIPQADAATSLALDARITRGWLQSAGEVVVSCARMQKESELAPSPLVAAIPLVSREALALARVPPLRDAMRASAMLEVVQDGTAPPVDPGSRTGGTRLFKDQAACPFRAVAHHRLRSERLESPRPGLDARDRGTLVHEMLRGVWKALGTRERLLAIEPAALDALLHACAQDALAALWRLPGGVLEGRFGALERARLVRLSREWLRLERSRGPFEVVTTEEQRAMSFGGIGVNVKLDRLDRIDGGYAVIDYKTGACKTGDWAGPRPEEPQVPMYASAIAGELAAVAFAQVRSGDCRFRGLARAGEPMPRVCTVDRDRTVRRHYRDWDALVGSWRESLESLGRGFAGGDARVDPKRGAATCENCDQHAFCRIAEKAPFGALDAQVPADE